jgi:hypothetical protein
MNGAIGNIRAGKALISAMLLLVFVLGYSRTSEALRYEAGFDGLLIGSDNIGRGPDNQRSEGYLSTLEAKMSVIYQTRASSMALSLSGGYEFRVADVTTESTNYFSRLTGRTHWSRTGYIEGTVSSSEGTAEPDLTDLSQARVRSKTSQTGLLIGGRPNPISEWQTLVDQRTEDRPDRELLESSVKFAYRGTVSAARRMSFETELIDGEEKVEDDEWTDTSANFEYRKQSSATATYGYRLLWEQLKLKQDGGSSNKTNKTTAFFFNELVIPSGWTLFSGLGVDALNLPEGADRVEPNADLGLTSPPKRRVLVTANISTNASIQDPVEAGATWTRNNRGLTSVLWNATRRYSVKPSVALLYSELYQNEVVSRKDQTLVLGLETTWNPSKHWSVELNGFAESRDSSDNTADLSENRIEFRVTGIFGNRNL